MSDSDPLLGRVLNHAYRVDSLIREGGMSIIYEAERQKRPRRRVALKLLHPLAAGDAEFAARFAQEQEILEEMDRHPHIVRMLDTDRTAEGQAYYVMELMQGETLRERLDNQGRLTVDEVVELVEQVGSALQALHERKIVHRDVIPENIFLQRRPESLLHATVFDLNLALRLNRANAGSSEVEGSLGYMSPEQARGKVAEIGPATDAFAMAAVVYEALGGKPAFPDAETEQDYLFLLEQDPTPINARVPELSPQVHQVISRGMARHKEDRYSSVEELVIDLRQALAGVARDTAQGFEAPSVEEDRGEAGGPQVEQTPEVDDRVTRVTGLPEPGALEAADHRVTEVVAAEDLPAALRVTEVMSEREVASLREAEVPAKDASNQRVTDRIPEEQEAAGQARVTEVIPQEEVAPDQHRVTEVVPQEEVAPGQQRATEFLAPDDLLAGHQRPTKILKGEEVKSAPVARRSRRARRVGRQAGVSTGVSHSAPTQILAPVRQEAPGQVPAESAAGARGHLVVLLVSLAAAALLIVGLVYAFGGDEASREPAKEPPRQPEKARSKIRSGGGSYSAVAKQQLPATKTPKQKTPAPPKAPRATRPIHLTSKPTGAEVYAAGKRIGKTPLKVLTPPGSSLFFLVKMEGYRDWRKNVPAGDGEIRLEAVLQKVPGSRPGLPPDTAPAPAAVRKRSPRPRAAFGRLRVGTMHRGAPQWANVYLDGKKMGQTPLVLNAVRAGRHRVEARRPGFLPASKQVVIRPGKLAAVLLELRK